MNDGQEGIVGTIVKEVGREGVSASGLVIARAEEHREYTRVSSSAASVVYKGQGGGGGGRGEGGGRGRGRGRGRHIQRRGERGSGRERER